MTAPSKVVVPSIRHMEWCQPTGDRTQIRIESFPFFSDDNTRGGRPVATHQITRCIECGEQTVKQIGA